jgi:multiple sugar transport system permease protein
VLAGPALLLFGAFIVLPFLLAVAFSFTDVKLLQRGDVQWTGIDNYVRLFSVRVVAAPQASDASALPPARQWRQLKRAATGDEARRF